MHPVWHNKQKLVFIKLPLFFLLSFCLFGAWLKHNELRQNFSSSSVAHVAAVFSIDRCICIILYFHFSTTTNTTKYNFSFCNSYFRLGAWALHKIHIYYYQKGHKGRNVMITKNQNLVLSNVNCCSNKVLQCKVCK